MVIFWIIKMVLLFYKMKRGNFNTSWSVFFVSVLATSASVRKLS